MALSGLLVVDSETGMLSSSASIGANFGLPGPKRHALQLAGFLNAASLTAREAGGELGLIESQGVHVSASHTSRTRHSCIAIGCKGQASTAQGRAVARRLAQRLDSEQMSASSATKQLKDELCLCALERAAARAGWASAAAWPEYTLAPRAEAKAMEGGGKKMKRGKRYSHDTTEDGPYCGCCPHVGRKPEDQGERGDTRARSLSQYEAECSVGDGALHARSLRSHLLELRCLEGWSMGPEGVAFLVRGRGGAIAMGAVSLQGVSGLSGLPEETESALEDALQALLARPFPKA